MHTRFSTLFQRYIEGAATREETDELEEMIVSGKHDDDLKASVARYPEIPEVRLEEEKLNEMISHITGRPESRVVPLAPHVKTRNLWAWTSAAAAVAILAVAWIWWDGSGQADMQDEIAQLAPVSYSGRQFVELPDGTRVTLNEGSEFTYQPSFGQGTREITLKGEAYFDVAHDPANPFIVHSGKVKTTVLGTAFNIKAYDGTPEVVVTVTRGKVQVEQDELPGNPDGEAVPEQTPVYLTANEQLSVNTSTNTFQKTTTATANEALAWQKEFLILNRVTMEEAARKIGERFGMKVTITNAGLKQCIIKATFLNGEGVEHVITSITRVMEAEYTINNGEIVIEGGKICD